MNDTVRPPSGWQAVYQLVSDAEARLTGRVSDVEARVAGLDAKMDTHLLEHSVSRGAAQARRGLLTATLAFTAKVIPIPALIVALLAVLGVHL